MVLETLERDIVKRIPFRVKKHLRRPSAIVDQLKPAVVVDRFDAWEEKARAYSLVKEALDAAHIDYALMPEKRGARTFVMDADDKDRAIREISATLASEDAWLLAPIEWGKVRVGLAVGLNHSGKASQAIISKHNEFRLFRHKKSADGKLFGKPACGATLQFWSRVLDADFPRPDGYTYDVGTLMAPRPNGICAYLSPKSWEESLSSPLRWPASAAQPHIYHLTEPIDVVYTWVDGADANWQQRKNLALGLTDTEALNVTAASAARYLSRNELMYSLRSIELYANWVRNIYIVTDHQVPSWLDTSNSRIRIINHEDIFWDTSVLPVFNSHAIESQLHHIDGLSDKFLYLNDDFLFGNIVHPEDFFYPNGMSKYFPSKACLDVAPPSARDLPVLSAAKNARQLIADEFGVTITNKFKHTPMPLQRDVLYEMENRFPDLFKAVAASKFRHPDDYSIPSGLYHFYAFATGRSVPSNISYGYQDLASADLPAFLHRLVSGNPYCVYCLNDNDASPEQMAVITKRVTEAMDKCYPFKSSFEN